MLNRTMIYNGTGLFHCDNALHIDIAPTKSGKCIPAQNLDNPCSFKQKCMCSALSFWKDGPRQSHFDKLTNTCPDCSVIVIAESCYIPIPAHQTLPIPKQNYPTVLPSQPQLNPVFTWFFVTSLLTCLISTLHF